MRHNEPVKVEKPDIEFVLNKWPDAIRVQKFLAKQSCCDPTDHGRFMLVITRQNGSKLTIDLN